MPAVASRPKPYVSPIEALLIVLCLLACGLSVWVYERHLTLASVRAKLADVELTLEHWQTKAKTYLARSRTV